MLVGRSQQYSGNRQGPGKDRKPEDLPERGTETQRSEIRGRNPSIVIASHFRPQCLCASVANPSVIFELILDFGLKEAAVRVEIASVDDQHAALWHLAVQDVDNLPFDAR